MRKSESMKFIRMFAAAICLVILVSGSNAQVRTGPLSIYSGGLAVGAMNPLNNELKKESDAFFKLAFVNSVHLTNVTHLFFDIDWLAPGSNFGTEVGLDFHFIPRQFSPFVGAGVGARYFDKNDGDFGDNFGLSGTVHAGVLMDVTETTRIRLRVPYQGVLNEARDHAVGVDVGILWSGPYRGVTKLHY